MEMKKMFKPRQILISMAAKKPTITRVRIAKEELEKMTKEDFQKCWSLQEQYIDHLENKLNSNSEHSELVSLRESEEKLKQQQLDATRRENILVMRLTTKEQEMQEYVGQIQELKQAQIPTVAQLRSALLDPSVNLLFERMRKEMDALKARLEETQNELNAWKFTPDSNTGKRLMAKCRLLYQENEELGKVISCGRMAKLEGDLALQKSFSEEMKKSQSELDEFLLELDEDVEGMQSTIYYLQQQLREAKDQILQMQKDKHKLNNLSNGSPSNHRLTAPEDSVDINDSERQEVSGPEQKTVGCSQSSVLSNDLNGTEGMSNPAADKGTNSHSPWTPPPYNEEKISIPNKIKENVESSTAKTKEVDHVHEQLAKQSPREVKAVSVVAENLNSSEKSNSVSEQKKIADSIDKEIVPLSNQTIKKEHLVSDESTVDKDLTKADAEVQKNLASAKRTSKGSKGHKRTRPRTCGDSTGEDSLPIRKRSRRRETETHPQDDSENRTSLEIDTDTEVQVAQTLAYWAAAKQERTETHQETVDGLVGNGELKNKKNSEEKS